MIHPKFAPLAIRRSHLPNHWDLMALLLIIGVIVLFAYGERVTTIPLSALDAAPLSLDPTNLPIYALRTILRMLAAIVFSLIFTLIYASVAAKSRRAEMVMIPVLDILQSVPILGFLTFTVTFFLNLFPGRVIGAELAAVFAIFTSQAWNMTFSLYQSMRSQPKDLEEATRSFQLSGWQRFWRLDVPFAMPGLVWNTMMSMSGGWFSWSPRRPSPWAIQRLLCRASVPMWRWPSSNRTFWRSFMPSSPCSPSSFSMTS